MKFYLIINLLKYDRIIFNLTNDILFLSLIIYFEIIGTRMCADSEVLLLSIVPSFIKEKFYFFPRIDKKPRFKQAF